MQDDFTTAIAYYHKVSNCACIHDNEPMMHSIQLLRPMNIVQEISAILRCWIVSMVGGIQPFLSKT